MEFTHTWTNGLIEFKNYANPDMKGIRFFSKGDRVEFKTEVDFKVNPEEGIQASYVYIPDIDPSNPELPVIVETSRLIVGNEIAELFTTGTLSLIGNKTIMQISTAPISSTDFGVKGEIRWTENYIYVCVDTDTWTRSDLNTF